MMTTETIPEVRTLHTAPRRCRRPRIPAVATARPAVAIVGGAGAMGRTFASCFERAGWDIRRLDRSDWGDAPALLAGCRVVLLSVPGPQAVRVIRRLQPFLTPEMVLADILSAKSDVIPAIRAHHRGPAVSLHPMFGPAVTCLAGQTIVVIPVRGGEAALGWLQEVLGPEGARFTYTTADEHERAMALVQALTHAALLCFGTVVAESGVDADRLRAFASPNFRILLDLVGRAASQSPDLYAELYLSSPDRADSVRRMRATADALEELVGNRDRAGIAQKYAWLADTFRGELPRALAESQLIVDTLARHTNG